MGCGGFFMGAPSPGAPCGGTRCRSRRSAAGSSGGSSRGRCPCGGTRTVRRAPAAPGRSCPCRSPGAAAPPGAPSGRRGRWAPWLSPAAGGRGRRRGWRSRPWRGACAAGCIVRRLRRRAVRRGSGPAGGSHRPMPGTRRPAAAGRAAVRRWGGFRDS